MMKTICPICGSSDIEGLLELHNIPYFENRLCENEYQARHDGCGVQGMAQCRHCGFVFNRGFEAKNVVYGNDYHAERGGSAYFRRYLKTVAEQINSACAIEGKRILEIACGTGEFLRMIAGYGPKSCIGVDPSGGAVQGSVTIHPILFDEAYLKQYTDPVDILISRHMIEHMEDPLKMLRLFWKALPEAGILYLETPRLDWILRNRVFYDFTYEHCSYYTDAFMGRLLSAAGFSLMEMKASFGGQYFSILAKKTGTGMELSPASPEELSRVELAFRETEAVYTSAKERFSALGTRMAAGHENVSPLWDSPPASGVYLWGAG